MSRWPAPAGLAASPAGAAVRAWGRLGYPRRALRLHACATLIVARHGGQVPAEVGDLRALPGVGDYTAAAVAAFAHRQRAVVLDTNVRRVLARVLGGAARPPTTTPTPAELSAAEELLPDDPAAAARWCVAVMELGALVCTARAHRAVPAARSRTAAASSPSVGRPATPRRAASRTTAPTASAGAACSACCARPPKQSPERGSTSPGTIRCNASVPSTGWSPTGCSYQSVPTPSLCPDSDERGQGPDRRWAVSARSRTTRSVTAASSAGRSIHSPKRVASTSSPIRSARRGGTPVRVR